MAKVPFGTELYGRLRHPDGTATATKFFHIAYLPLVPLGTFHVASEDAEGFRGQPIRWSGKSLFSAYFKVWGFFLCAALVVIGTNGAYASDFSIPQALVIQLGSMAMIAALIASWFWLGSDGRQSKGRKAVVAIGLPIVVLTVFYGVGMKSRFQLEGSASDDGAGEDRVAAAKIAAEKEALTTSIKQAKAYEKRLYPLLKSVYEKKDWEPSGCDDSYLSSKATTASSKRLIITEYNHLAYLLNAADIPEAYLRAWLTTPALAELGRTRGEEQKALLEDLRARPFIGVWVILDRETKKQNKRRTLTAKLAIFEYASGRWLCNTRISVDSTAGRGQEPPPQDVQAAFKQGAQKALAQITEQLTLY